MRPRTAIPILVAFLAIAGCSDDEGAPRLTAAVDTVDGTWPRTAGRARVRAS